MNDDLVGPLSNCMISYNVKQNVNQSNLDEQVISDYETSRWTCTLVEWELLRRRGVETEGYLRQSWRLASLLLCSHCV